MGKLTVTYRDHDAEVSTAQFPSSDLNDVNIADQITAANTLRAELADVTLCQVQQYAHEAERVEVSTLSATDPNARREAKALVKYHSAISGLKYSLEIPGPDMSKKNATAKGKFYVPGSADNHADWDAFVTAFEAFVKVGASSLESVVVDEVLDVGRNT